MLLKAGGLNISRQNLRCKTMQSKKASVIESITGRVIGFCVAFGGQRIIFPILGIEVSYTENLYIAVFFFTLGVTQNYLVRRFFNWLTVRSVKR